MSDRLADFTEDPSRFHVHPYSAHNTLGQGSVNALHLPNRDDEIRSKKVRLLSTLPNTGWAMLIRECIVEHPRRDGTSV